MPIRLRPSSTRQHHRHDDFEVAMIITLQTPGTAPSAAPNNCGIMLAPTEPLIRHLASLERELFGRQAWSQAMLREEFSAPDRTYVLDVAEPIQDDEPVIRGYGGFWYDGEDAELMTIGVATLYQRCGIASGMLDALMMAAKHQHARRMLLEVRVDNEPALRLYRQFGFELLGVRKRYYQPENIDAYTMASDLAVYMSKRDEGKRRA